MTSTPTLPHLPELTTVRGSDGLRAAGFAGGAADERRNVMKSRRTAAVMALILTIAASANALAEGMWGKIGRALKEGEQDRAFCVHNPNNDICKPMVASTLLFLCESSTPVSLGRCTGAIHAYALEGKKLDAWLCVPEDALDNDEQLRRLFIREGERMPEVFHRQARLLLYYAVAKAFPCPLRNTSPKPR